MKKPVQKAAPAGADLRLDDKDVAKMKQLFAEGHAEFQKDPERYLTEKRLREDQTTPFHGFHQLLPLKDAAPTQAELAKAFYDHTQAIAMTDEQLYERVKKLMVRRGYHLTDFDEGGPLYGWSTNELLDLLGREPWKEE